MTKTRERILAAISTHWQENGYAPTTRELCNIVGIKSTATMHGHLRRLRNKGMITWEAGRVRTLRVVQDA